MAKWYEKVWGVLEPGSKGVYTFTNAIGEGEGLSGAIDETWDSLVTLGGTLDKDNAYGKDGTEIAQDYQDQVQSAQDVADDIWGIDKSVLEGATKRADGSDRTIASALNKYDETIDGLNKQAQEQMNAQARANEFMNPYTQYQIDQANKSIEGASGAKLQSLATQNKIANNTANMQGNAYNSAVNSALTNASQNLGNINAQSANAGNILTNDAMPQQDLIAMNNDWASEKLDTANASAEMVAQTMANAGGDAGNLFVTTKGSK